MDYFRPMVRDGYEWINCVDLHDYENFLKLDGGTRRTDWTPILVRRVTSDEGEQLKPSDFPWLGAHTLIMRERAVRALQEILDAHGELLPLATEDNVKLFAFNARVADALDEAKSDVMLIPGTNKIMRIKKPVFFEPAIFNLDIFRLPGRGMPTYVGERFVHRANEAGLLGLEFEKVWSSD